MNEKIHNKGIHWNPFFWSYAYGMEYYHPSWRSQAAKNFLGVWLTSLAEANPRSLAMTTLSRHLEQIARFGWDGMKGRR